MVDLFRKKALDTIASPEQLDQQVKIMRPASWVVYTAILLTVTMLALWSVTHPITESIDVSGVIFTNNNIVNSVSTRDCLLQDILVKEGDHVEIGDILAVTSDEEGMEEIQQFRYEMSQTTDAAQYAQMEEQLEKKIQSYVAKTIVKSSSSGSVQSVQHEGKALTMGESIATVIADYGYNEVIAYVPLEQIGKLELGSSAQISVSYAPREEYGYMTGIVTYIGTTPVTDASLQQKMGSFSHIDNLLPSTSSVEVRIRLDLDEYTKNGYHWSNEKGGKLNIDMGTICSVFIITKEYLPIEMLFS